jgi:hypothetical protein
VQRGEKNPAPLRGIFIGRGAVYRPAFCCATIMYSIGIDSMVLKRDVSIAMRAA